MSNLNYDKYTTHISSEHKLFQLKLKDVWQYRDLISMFTKRYFKLQYKQMLFGPVWLLVNPIISSIMYAFVFGGIAKIGTDGIPSILFYLCGNAMWGFFASCFAGNSFVFVGNAYLFGKVYFPRLTIPVSTVINSIVKYCIQMISGVCFLGYFVITGAVHPHWWAMIFIPIILVHLGIMGMGMGIIASSVTTKYRDLSILIDYGLSLWMYATPVIYPLSQVTNPLFRRILLFNPVTVPIEIYRYALFGIGTIDFVSLATSWVFTICVAIFGIMVFNKVERTFMDTV